MRILRVHEDPASTNHLFCFFTLWQCQCMQLAAGSGSAPRPRVPMAMLGALLTSLLLPLAAPPNTCTPEVGVFFNNTDYADGSGPRVAKDAADCCSQCITAHNCQYWSFNIDDKSFPGVTDCKWAHLTHCCYFHSSNVNSAKGEPSPGTKGMNGWTSGGFAGKKPGPPPPPPPCDSFTTQSICPPARCMWDTKANTCTNKPPPPPPPGPCFKATQAQCGVGKPPYSGAKVFCANACQWNGTALGCIILCMSRSSELLFPLKCMGCADATFFAMRIAHPVRMYTPNTGAQVPPATTASPPATRFPPTTASSPWSAQPPRFPRESC